MSKRLENYTEKPITEFTNDDTLYLSKMSGNFQHIILMNFVSFSKGIVTGEILDIQPNNMQGIWAGNEYYKIGGEISGRVNKCFLFNDKCHWFNKDKNGLYIAR